MPPELADDHVAAIFRVLIEHGDDLITTEGPLDLCFAPAGFSGGFDDLVSGAVTIAVSSVDISVASLADVVASKRAAGRPKDVVALSALKARLRDR
jgi:hypothetical protein